jgi:hypothetical protein
MGAISCDKVMNILMRVRMLEDSAIAFLRKPRAA